MKIEKIGQLYVIRGRYCKRYFTACGQTASEAIASLWSEIAIIRSLTAWNNK